MVDLPRPVVEATTMDNMILATREICETMKSTVIVSLDIGSYDAPMITRSKYMLIAWNTKDPGTSKDQCHHPVSYGLRIHMAV
jgi:hypothetical protein